MSFLLNLKPGNNLLNNRKELWWGPPNVGSSVAAPAILIPNLPVKQIANKVSPFIKDFLETGFNIINKGLSRGVALPAMVLTPSEAGRGSDRRFTYNPETNLVEDVSSVSTNSERTAPTSIDRSGYVLEPRTGTFISPEVLAWMTGRRNFGGKSKRTQSSETSSDTPNPKKPFNWKEYLIQRGIIAAGEGLDYFRDKSIDWRNPYNFISGALRLGGLAIPGWMGPILWGTGKIMNVAEPAIFGNSNNQTSTRIPQPIESDTSETPERTYTDEYGNTVYNDTTENYRRMKE